MPDAAWMEVGLRFFGEVVLRATGLLLLALLAGWALRRASAATRRRLCAGTIVGLLLLPGLSALLPRLPVMLLPARSPTAPLPSLAGPVIDAAQAAVWGERRRVRAAAKAPGGAPAPAVAAPTPGLPALHAVGDAPSDTRADTHAWITWALAALYLLGFGIALRRLILARWRAARLVRGADRTGPPWQLPAGVDSLESEAVALPQTLGSGRGVVLLPRAGRSWPAPWRDAVVAHEVAHVRGWDPLWQLLGEIACALYWFHPLAHVILRQLRIERELAADDATLAAGFLPSDYARVLFELACIPDEPARLGAVVPLLTPGGLKARIRALLEPRRPRRAARGVGLVLVAVGLLAILPLASAVPARLPAQVDPAARWLVGRVVDPEARPVAGAAVSFRPDGMAWFTLAAYAEAVTVLSDGSGRFYYPDGYARDESFDVYARKGTLAARKGIYAVKYGTPMPTVLQLRPGQALAGTVHDDAGRPVEGATIRILDDKRHAPGPGPQELARSDRDGRWRIDGMLYGEFQLVIRAPWGVATALEARIEDRDVSGLKAVLPRAWAATGWVKDESGRPLAGVRVEQGHLRISRWPPGSTYQRLPGERHIDWDESAPDGSFRLLGLGRPLLAEARDAHGNELFGEVHPGGRAFLGSPPPGVPWGGPPPFTVTMVRGARIRGFVRTPDGRPVADARVTATPASGSQRRYFPVETRTDGAGRFELAVLATDFTLSARALDGRQARHQAHVQLEPGPSRADGPQPDVLLILPAFTPPR